MTEEEIKQLTIPLIKEELRLRRVPFKASLKKDGLLEKLREALSQQSPKYTQEQLDALGAGTKKKKEDDMTAFKVGAWWRELHPMEEQVDEPANEQFPAARAPTIPEADREVPLKPKYNYAEKWDRPPFKGSAHGQERVKGRANDAFLKVHNLDKDSSPVEFAEAFLPMFKNTKPWIPNPKEDPEIECKNLHGRFFSMEECARVTNIRAERAFVGEATYRDQFHDRFSVKEIRQFLGLYVLNGLSPSPSLDKKFERNDKANFNPFVNANVGGANPQKRLKIFKAYFGVQCPDKPVPERKTSPLFKVLPIIKQIRKIGPVAWDCGKNIAVDEQTISMKGHHADKMRITFKKQGMGSSVMPSVMMASPTPSTSGMNLLLPSTLLWVSLLSMVESCGSLTSSKIMATDAELTTSTCHADLPSSATTMTTRSYWRVLPEREEEFHSLLFRRKSRVPLKPQPEALSRQLCWKGTLTALILWLSVSMTPSQSTSSPWSLSALSGLPSLERCGMQLFRLWFLWNF
jgi:hypothetical protein